MSPPLLLQIMNLLVLLISLSATLRVFHCQHTKLPFDNTLISSQILIFLACMMCDRGWREIAPRRCVLSPLATILRIANLLFLLIRHPHCIQAIMARHGDIVSSTNKGGEQYVLYVDQGFLRFMYYTARVRVRDISMGTGRIELGSSQIRLKNLRQNEIPPKRNLI